MIQEAPEDEQIIIYVGTRRLVAVMGTFGRGEPRIVRYCELKNPEGFAKGLVTHLEKATASLEKLVEQLFPPPCPSEISAFVILGNSKLKTYRFSSCQHYQGLRRSISPSEIRSVVEQTRSVATLPLSEFILQAVPESFLVNDMPNIRNPMGLEANRLGVNLNLFTMDFMDFRNISKAFEAAEIEVQGYFPKTLTVSDAVLTEEEKEEGALILDISDDVTQLVLWKNGNLVSTRVVSVGGDYLTRCIAETWQIEPRDAEKVKEKFATLEQNLQFGEELIPLLDRNGKGNHRIHRQSFQQKFREQARPWMEQILKEAETFAKDEKVLHPHFVFTGGGTSLHGFVEFLKEEFSKDARMGCTRKLEASTELLVDPSLTGALGMFRWLATDGRDRDRLFEPRGLVEKTFASARNWFSHYF